MISLPIGISMAKIYNFMQAAGVADLRHTHDAV